MARLLLIDDEGIVRGALKAVLAQQGHDVSVAADGPAGLALMNKELPDLIILDRDLPGMTGSEVLAEIRALSREVGVIVLTGYPDAEGERKYRALGVGAFLSKATGIEGLLKVIERELSKAPRGAAAGAPRILIADDDPSVLGVLRRFLGAKGYRVETAADGEAALAALEAFRPHLLLLDVHMPALTGLETLRRMRQAGNQTAVMMITGGEEMETARECMALGACDYIVKPFNFEYLEMSVWAKILTATP